MRPVSLAAQQPPVLTWSRLCACVRSQLSLLIRTPVLADEDPTLLTSLNLNYSLKTLFPNSVTLGIRADYGRDTGKSIIDASFIHCQKVDT